MAIINHLSVEIGFFKSTTFNPLDRFSNDVI